MKKCKGPCNQVKEDQKFYIKRYKSGTVGLRSYCIECKEKMRNEWRDKNKEYDNARNNAYNKTNALKIKGWKLIKYWPGSTWQEALDNYSQLEQKQGGVCAIDGKLPGKRGFHVDHEHSTGKVRGLLCNGCNRGLGLLGDNLDGLSKAIDYLKKAA